MRKTVRDPRSVLITGASSGIGEALALNYAAPGVFLALSGRDVGRLEAVAKSCRDKGGVVDARIVHVTERKEMGEWIAEVDSTHPLDLAIANAGISGGTSGSDTADPEDLARLILSVNLEGVLNTVYPAVGVMKVRGRGQIAIVSSVAAFRGLPSTPAYSASKAAVKSWGEALRPVLREDGIQLSVICPGYVKSRITDLNTLPMPFFMDAERAALIIRHGLEKDRGRITFPWQMAIIGWLLSTLPPSWTDRMLMQLPKKEGNS